MQKDPTQFLTVFRSISHAHFQIDLYEDLFLKAFIQVAKKEFEETDLQELSKLAHECYELLFITKNDNLRIMLSTIKNHLLPNRTLEYFLSNYFYIVLNHYTKSFYTHSMGWKRIAKLSEAVDALIDWSKTVSFDNIDEELYLSPDERAIEALEMIRSKKAKISLLNTYQGVPIQYRATVVHTTENHAYLKVHPIQEAAARQQQSIYILGFAPLEYDLFARAKAVRYQGHVLLELSQFSLLKESIYQRQSVRVQTKRSIAINFEHEKVSYKVQLFDLSIGGLAIITTKNINLPQYASVELRIPDLLLGKAMNIQGTFIHQSKFENSDKLHFKLNLTAAQERLLSQFIVKREQEIIQELKIFA